MIKRKKLIIDTDCGSDDAMALALALRDQRYEVVMINTVSGNVPVDQAVQNTLTTIERTGTYAPPVYRGCEHMLLRSLECAFDTHGTDGMGDKGFVPQHLKATPGNGTLKMLEFLREAQPGEIDVIALGPLTNLALALRLDPEAVSKIGTLYVMGTAGLGKGNVTPVAEFNIWQDAEAAKIVLESNITRIVAVGWDACLGECILNVKDIMCISNSSKLGAFLIECNETLIALNQKRFGVPCLDMADPSAMCAALCTKSIAQCGHYYCEVDVSKGPSYGSVLIDVDGIFNKEPNILLVTKLHASVYKNYIFDMLKSGIE